jgi:DNA-binding transcriptional ArsR family regulator
MQSATGNTYPEVRLALNSADAGLDLAGDGQLVVDDRTYDLQIIRRSGPVPGELSRSLSRPEQGQIGLVVGDRLSKSVREEIKQAGWSWLDLRGHLFLRGPGLRVDAPVDPYGDAETRGTRNRPRINPFSPSGRRVVLQLLIDSEPRGVRALARETDLSPATTSRILDALRAEGLVNDDNPVIPELFWELATHWKSSETVTVGDITDQELNGLGYEWALGGAVGAWHHGAPVVIGPDTPRMIYLPDSTALRIAAGGIRHSSDPGRTTVLAVWPVPHPPQARSVPDSDVKVVHPIVAALDLAADPSRGAEIVRDWDPDPAACLRAW